MVACIADCFLGCHVEALPRCLFIAFDEWIERLFLVDYLLPLYYLLLLCYWFSLSFLEALLLKSLYSNPMKI